MMHPTPISATNIDGDALRATDHDSFASGFLAEMIDAGVEVDASAQRISEERWAIHARVAYDGEIIVAVFAAIEVARQVIAHHPPATRPAVGPTDRHASDLPAR